MSFMSKIKKSLSLGLAIGGGVLTVTGAALLGVGCNYTSTTEFTIGNVKNSQTIGVGSQNYYKLISGYTEVNGKKTQIPQSEIDDYNKELDSANSERPKSYNDFLKKTREDKENSQKKIDALREQLSKLPQGTPDSIKAPLIQAVDQAEKSLKTFDDIEAGYAMMVSGAVLFTIFVLVMAFGVTALVLQKKY